MGSISLDKFKKLMWRTMYRYKIRDAMRYKHCWEYMDIKL
jgi:hypothetical protein